MAECIDRAELSVTPIDITDLPTDKCLMVYLAEDVDSLPTADVIERAEYEELNDKYLKAIHNHTECLKELHELRSKISRTIEEIKELYTEWENLSDDAKLETNPFGAVLNIMQRNIGE